MRASLSRLSIAISLLALGGPVAAQPEGDRALGRYLSGECASCHQSSGRQVGAIPVIAGYPAEQFVAVIAAYRDGRRDNQIMRTIAAGLSPTEVAALAAYYQSLEPAN